MEFSAETLPFGVSLGKSLHLLVFLVVNGVSGAALLMEGMYETEFSLTHQNFSGPQTWCSEVPKEQIPVFSDIGALKGRLWLLKDPKAFLNPLSVKILG